MEQIEREIDELRQLLESLEPPKPGPEWEFCRWVVVAQTLIDLSAFRARQLLPTLNHK